ncbi:MAG TPA: DUF2231 domain-containing protein [Gemmatimonadaceae bacterium]|nr:DUF2231 domain-containing protein [Gemmatimonadaceae bacterium]
MESRAKLFGHPIHQQLIVFPLGLLVTSIIFDVIHLVTSNSVWAVVSFWMIVAGVAGGLAAAPFGIWDWIGIPNNTRAKRIGLLHGVGNVVVILLFAASLMIRKDNAAAPEGFAILLSAVGVAIGAVTGWLGGELVTRLGIGVDSGANPEAPNSLSAQSARPTQR